MSDKKIDTISKEGFHMLPVKNIIQFATRKEKTFDLAKKTHHVPKEISPMENAGAISQDDSPVETPNAKSSSSSTKEVRCEILPERAT